MDKRKLGRTGQMSSILTFGAAAFSKISQAKADAAIGLAIEHGINHFDVAPSYGQAEIRLGPWMEKHHEEVFLACKTAERTKKEAWNSLRNSLKALRVDYFDLFQFHSVSDLETLDTILGDNGALEAVLEAKEQGLVRNIGITGHSPCVLVEALNRFDFATVLFPLNRVLTAHRTDYSDVASLVDITRQKNVGTIAIKAVAKQPWGEKPHIYSTWYEPFDQPADIDKSLWHTLSHDITTAVLPSDVSLWPAVIDAAERFKPLSPQEQEEAVSQVRQYRTIFPVT